jgi:hypothetical protein
LLRTASCGRRACAPAAAQRTVGRRATATDLLQRIASRVVVGFILSRRVEDREMSERPRWSALWQQAQEAKANARMEMDRAVRLMEEAAREARVALPEADGDLARLMHSLACLYREIDRLDDAIAAARAGLTFRRAMTPRSAGLIGNDVMFLCLALWEKGSIGEALTLSEEGLSLYEEALGPDHGEVRYVRSVVEQLRVRQQK